MEEQKQPEKQKITYVTDLSPGKQNLVAEGYAFIRVPRRNDAGGLEIQVVAIPITTKRLLSAAMHIDSNRPRPPSRDILAQPDSEIGKGLGLTKATAVTVFDMTDQNYTRRSAEFNIESGYIMAGAAIDLPLYIPLPGGGQKEASTFEERAEAVKALNLDAASIGTIYAEANRLAVFSNEERRAFFFDASARP